MPEGWTVTSQVQTIDTEPGTGRVRDVVEVAFRTRRGAAGRVLIPVEEYSAARVVEVVEPVAAELEAAFDL